MNLDRRGIDIGSVLCPICGAHVETVNFLLFSCGMSMDLWTLLSGWWEMDLSIFFFYFGMDFLD